MAEESGKLKGQIVQEFDAVITDMTVLRVAVKSFDGIPFYDIRLWGRTKQGNLYPKRKGLCMRAENWKTVFKILSDNSLVFNPQPNQVDKDA